MKAGKAEARLQGRVGDGAIAEYPATGSGYARACNVSRREACRCDPRPRRRKGPPREMAGSERAIPNSTATDARATDGTAGKSPTAASKTPSADSDMPTEATASAATTTWTGFRCVGDRGNCEEQDRGGGNASH